MQDQSQTVAFLMEAAGPGAERVETHISIVVIGAERVFKLKRAVRFPYLDFSTVEMRLAACERELELNRRTAPNLYVGVRQVTRASDSVAFNSLAFDGEGALVDSVVEMRRFPALGLFDAMAQRGELSRDLLTQLARRIAAFHVSLDRVEGGGAHAIEAALDANEGGFAEAKIFDPSKLTRLLNLCRMRLDQYRHVLDARADAGFVRRCHGDLHLRNICLFEGAPTLFDCLEFNEELATTDVLYDLAFLLMDLVHRGLREDANLVFNRYLDETGDDGALAIMPFFMAVRAAVRAHVGAATAGEDSAKADEARAYLDLALALLAPHAPRLVAIGGLSGSGKSSVAGRLACDLDLPPGARILSTDRVRKRLAGLAAETPMPAAAYTPQSSDLVYAAQREQAGRVLDGGWSVVVDGVFLKPEERTAAAVVAQMRHVPFDGLWLDASRDVLAARIAARVNDPSDATLEVLDRQWASNPGAGSWAAVDASGSIAQSATLARSALKPAES